MSARISVILVTYNHEAFLAEAIDSVLRQSAIDDVEIIITEDGSSDGTKAIAERYVAAHPDRIRAIFSPVNLRSTVVLSRAIRAASGEYIAYLDGDDYWSDPDKLAKQMALMDAKPQMTMCYHNAMHVGSDGTPLGHNHLPEGVGPVKMRDLILANPVPTCSVFYRASAITPLPQWMDSAPCGDWPLHLLAALKGEIGYIPEVMAAYRQHAGGSWTNLTWAERYGMLAAWFGFLHKVLPPEHHQAVDAAAAWWNVAARVHEEDVVGAVSAVQEAVALDPDVDRYFTLLVALIGTRGEAKTILDLISAVAPDRADYLIRVSAHFARLDFEAECRQALQGAIFALEDGTEAQKPNDQLATALGFVVRYLRERGHAVDAEAAVRQAAIFAPDGAGPRGQLANLMLDRGNYDEALEVLEEAVRLNPTEVRYRLRLAGVYHRTRKYSEEEEQLREAAVLEPKRADIVYRLANAVMAQGRRKEAVAGLRRCLELDPGHEHAQRRLAKLQTVSS